MVWLESSEVSKFFLIDTNFGDYLSIIILYNHGFPHSRKDINVLIREESIFVYVWEKLKPTSKLLNEISLGC